MNCLDKVYIMIIWDSLMFYNELASQTFLEQLIRSCNYDGDTLHLIVSCTHNAEK